MMVKVNKIVWTEWPSLLQPPVAPSPPSTPTEEPRGHPLPAPPPTGERNTTPVPAQEERGSLSAFLIDFSLNSHDFSMELLTHAGKLMRYSWRDGILRHLELSHTHTHANTRTVEVLRDNHRVFQSWISGRRDTSGNFTRTVSSSSSSYSSHSPMKVKHTQTLVLSLLHIHERV